MQEKYIKSVEECLNWTENIMLTFDSGYWGVYERIRIDQNERVCHCRPDGSSELMQVLNLYKQVTESKKYDRVYENQINWLKSMQNGPERVNFGSFPFAAADGTRKYYEIPITFPNDNGKVLLNLLDLFQKTQDKRLLDMALPLADYWISIQTDKGTYYLEDHKEFMHNKHYGPCFVLWMIAAMYKCYAVTGSEKYLRSGEKAFEYILNCIKGDRLLTSMEIDNDEQWRPASSESVMALLCLTIAYRCHQDQRLKDTVYLLLNYVKRLIDPETGAIRNCDNDSIHASENNDPMLCDLVYTQGFALNAFIEMYETYNDQQFLSYAIKLANWLMLIQCKDESPHWDGGWRGAYSLKTKGWDGRGNQSNPILDEGGTYVVYTGWTAYPISMGLLRLALLDK